MVVDGCGGRRGWGGGVVIAAGAFVLVQKGKHKRRRGRGRVCGNRSTLFCWYSPRSEQDETGSCVVACVCFVAL